MKHVVFIGLLVGIIAVATSASAHIYLDEDFEGASVFTDQDWPIKNDNTTDVTPAVIAVKGVNLRCYDGTAGQTSPKPIISNTGAVVAERFYRGTKSLKLDSGQSVGVAPTGNYTGADAGNIRVLQFAIGCTTESAALAPGTRIGQFRQFYSTVTTDTLATSLTLGLVVNGSGSIDLICDNTGAVIGSLSGGPGDWKLVTIVTNIRYETPPTLSLAAWQMQDPLTNVYKGPITGGEPTTYPEIPSGAQIYVNNKAAALALLPDEIGTGWGNDNVGDNSVLNSSELGWELAAMNGGTVYIDNLYWDGGWHSDYAQKATQEMAARITEFDTPSTEAIPPSAGARNWEVYR